MSQRTLRSAFLVAAGVSLVACSAPGLPEQLPFAEPGVSFTVAPASTGCTDSGAYRGKVSWDVPAAISSKIEIQVGAQERKVFARSNESAGSEETGDWVSEGMVFALVDRDSDMPLAAIKAGPGQCAAAAATMEADADTTVEDENTR